VLKWSALAGEELGIGFLMRSWGVGVATFF
jgi:hypothetical protein